MEDNFIETANFEDAQKELIVQKNLENFQIRESITSIFASLPLLAESINNQETEKAMETLNNVYRKTYIIFKSYNNMLTASRLMTDEKMSKFIIDYSNMLKTLFSSVSMVLPAYCKIEIDVQDGCFIKTNPYILSQGLLNMVLNSIDYRKEDNVNIFVSLKQKNGRCVLTYKDNSIGISSEIIKDIFKPYFSANPYNDGGVNDGIGLGLYILNEAVNLSQGTIFVNSEFSEGVTAVISIPGVSEIDEINIVKSEPKDYLLNKYSDVFVQLSKYCTLPDLI